MLLLNNGINEKINEEKRKNILIGRAGRGEVLGDKFCPRCRSERDISIIKEKV